MNDQIASFRTLQNTGLSLVSHKEVKKLIDEKENKEKELHRLKQRAKWMKERRFKTKETLKKLSQGDENVAKALKFVNRETPGRPRIETDQPQLLATILDIVRGSSAADARRRTEMIRTITTLDDLQKELTTNFGFNLSRTATYYRLLPKRGNTNASLRHVQTVPVRLLRYQQLLHYYYLFANFLLLLL